MPTIMIEDLEVTQARLEMVKPAGGQPYVQATIDYELLDENGNAVIRKGVVRFGPNSGLPAEQHINAYIAAVLEEAFERTITLFKVQEGLLPADTLEGEPPDQLASGVVYTHSEG